MMRLDEKEDKRPYSKVQIQNAFFSLLEQESYQHLTIAMILDEAQISRRTFYRHYPNKQAIVEDYLESLCDGFCTQLKLIVKETSLYDVLVACLDYFYQEVHHLILLSKNNILYLLLENFKNNELLIVEQLRGSERFSHYNSENFYLIKFLIGGCFTVIESALQQTPPPPPEVIASDLVALLHSNINQ